MGNVMITVCASGRVWYGLGSSDRGSKANGIVESRPERVVAAYVMERAVQSGMKKVEVQPAPRIRISTGVVIFGDLTLWGFGWGD